MSDTTLPRVPGDPRTYTGIPVVGAPIDERVARHALDDMLRLERIVALVGMTPERSIATTMAMLDDRVMDRLSVIPAHGIAGLGQRTVRALRSLATPDSSTLVRSLPIDIGVDVDVAAKGEETEVPWPSEGEFRPLSRSIVMETSDLAVPIMNDAPIRITHLTDPIVGLTIDDRITTSSKDGGRVPKLTVLNETIPVNFGPDRSLRSILIATRRAADALRSHILGCSVTDDEASAVAALLLHQHAVRRREAHHASDRIAGRVTFGLGHRWAVRVHDEPSDRGVVSHVPENPFEASRIAMTHLAVIDGGVAIETWSRDFDETPDGVRDLRRHAAAPRVLDVATKLGLIRP